MALDLGSLFFGVKVDTDDLKKAEASMDQFGSGARTAEKDVDALGRGTKDATGKMSTGFGSAKTAIVGMIGAYAGFAAAKSALTGVISTTAEFSKSISNLSAITGATGKDLQFYSDQAKEIGRTTSLSASQAAEAFKLIASAKPDLLSSAASLAAVTKEAVTLAEAASISLPEAANALGNSLNQFSAGADQASRFINVLAAGAKFGASSIADTSMALKASGAAANAAGLSFEATNAGIQALAAGGIRAAEAGTGLRNVLLILEQEADENLRPSVVGLGAAIQNLSDKNLTLTETTDMFGRESAIAALTLVEQSGALGGLIENLTGTSTATEQAATNLDNLAGDVLASKSAFEALQIAVGERFEPSLRSATRSAAEFSSSLAEFVGSEDFSDFISNASDLVKALGVTITGFATIQLVRFIANTKLATLAQAAFNRVALLNPYVAVAVGVTALTFGLMKYTREQKKASAALNEYIRGVDRFDPLMQAAINGSKAKKQALDVEAQALAVATEETISLAEATVQLSDDVEEVTMSYEELNATSLEVLRTLSLEREALTLSSLQLEIRNNLFKAGVDATSDLGRQIVAATTDLHREADALAAVGAAAKQAEKDNEVAQANIARASSDAARSMQENQARTHEYMTVSLIDIAENGGNAFDNIAKSFETMVKRMWGEWAASGLMKLFGLGGGGFNMPSFGGGGGGSMAASAATSGAANAVASGIAPSLIGGTGGTILAAGGQFLGGLTGTAVGAGSAIVGAPTAAAAAGAGTGSTIAALATNPVTIGVAAALGAAYLLQTKPTPSGNAGLLIHDAPGAPANQKFAVAPFASGFAPIGFARREDQSSAAAVIDVFRQYDSVLTNLASSVGVSVNYSNNPFGGFDENGQGNGLFLGQASESGNPVGAGIDHQLTQFVGQWIDALGNQITDEEKRIIKSAGSADQMIAAAQGLVNNGINGSHANGLNRVPFDGYIAELHQGERVLTGAEASAMDSGMNSGIMVELKRIADSVKKSADILTRVTRDGDALLTESFA